MSTTTNHTPGPWKVVNDTLYGKKVIGPEVNGASPILHFGDGPDAKLIAAAPELASALLELLHASNFDPEKPLSDNAAALSRIAMAQAKAKTAYENATANIVYFEE